MDPLPKHRGLTSYVPGVSEPGATPGATKTLWCRSPIGNVTGRNVETSVPALYRFAPPPQMNPIGRDPAERHFSTSACRDADCQIGNGVPRSSYRRRNNYGGKVGCRERWPLYSGRTCFHCRDPFHMRTPFPPPLRDLLKPRPITPGQRLRHKCYHSPSTSVLGVRNFLMALEQLSGPGSAYLDQALRHPPTPRPLESKSWGVR